MTKTTVEDRSDNTKAILHVSVSGFNFSVYEITIDNVPYLVATKCDAISIIPKIVI